MTTLLYLYLGGVAFTFTWPLTLWFSLVWQARHDRVELAPVRGDGPRG